MLAAANPVEAATSSPNRANPFARYPEWLHDVALNGVILDAGCGYGRVSIPLLQRSADRSVIGVDAAAPMLDYFGELAAENGVLERVCLIKSDLTDIPLNDASVDHFFTSAVLLHNSYPAAKAIVKELFRVLKTGGTGIFIDSFPNLLNPSGVQSMIYSALARQRNGPVRPYTRNRVRQLLAPYSSELEIWGSAVQIAPVPLFRLAMFDKIASVARRTNARLSANPNVVARANRSGWFVHTWQAIAKK
jgi:SAM-dependent methyltransferase